MIEYTVKVHPNGDREWLVGDVHSREDGPAIECANGHREWYLDGVEFTELEYKIATKAANSGGVEIEVAGVKYIVNLKGQEDDKT